MKARSATDSAGAAARREGQAEDPGHRDASAQARRPAQGDRAGRLRRRHAAAAHAAREDPAQPARARAHPVASTSPGASRCPGSSPCSRAASCPSATASFPGPRTSTALARDKVRFVGDAVAAVAAVDELTAEEALELIDVEYEVLPALDRAPTPRSLDPEVEDSRERQATATSRKHVDLAVRRRRRRAARARSTVDERVLLRGLDARADRAALRGRRLRRATATSPSGRSTQIPHYVHRELAQGAGSSPEPHPRDPAVPRRRVRRQERAVRARVLRREAVDEDRAGR